MKIKSVILKGTLLVFASALLLTGCGKSNQEKVIAKMFDKNDSQKVKVINVYSYINMSSADSSDIICENDWNVSYRVNGDTNLDVRVTGHHSQESPDNIISQDDDIYYVCRADQKTYYSYQDGAWKNDEAPLTSYINIDGKSVKALKETLRSIWNKAELSEKVETLGGKTCYILNAEITGSDYVELMGSYMTSIGREEDWTYFVEDFQQNNKSASLEGLLNNCRAKLVGYVDKATGQLKVVDVDIDIIKINEVLDSVDILPADNQIISNVTEADYVINNMFFSISFLNDQESIEIPEGINNIQ